jgi:hypothetical protein
MRGDARVAKVNDHQDTGDWHGESPADQFDQVSAHVVSISVQNRPHRAGGWSIRQIITFGWNLMLEQHQSD